MLQDFAQIRKEFPDASVFASTFDSFTVKLQTVAKTLPIVTGMTAVAIFIPCWVFVYKILQIPTGEIGDTWIHGVASDPLKVAQFREIMRFVVS